jgi:hypothetical protein
MRKTGIVVVLCAGVALVFPGGTTVAIAQLAPDAPSRADPAQETDTVVLPRRSTGRTVVRVGVPRVESPPANLRLSLDGFRVENNPRVAADEIERVLAPSRARRRSRSGPSRSTVSPSPAPTRSRARCGPGPAVR